MTKGSLIIEGFDAVPFCVAHNDQGTTYVQGKGKWRCTSLSAPRWNWREQAPKPTEGRAADLQVIASKSVDNVPQLKAWLWGEKVKQTARESLRLMMQWDKVTRCSDVLPTDACKVPECPCNQEACGEVLQVLPNAVQSCLKDFGPEAS
eukprot:g29491.t1